MSYNSGVIGLVVSNRPRATRSADLKLLARLLPELYSTQSYYHYLSRLLKIRGLKLFKFYMNSNIQNFLLLTEVI